MSSQRGGRPLDPTSRRSSAGGEQVTVDEVLGASGVSSLGDLSDVDNAVTPAKGSLLVGNGAVYSELLAGAAGQILMYDPALLLGMGSIQAIERYLFSITSQSVPAASTWTFIHTFSGSNYTHGFVNLMVPNLTGPLSANRRKIANISFSQDPNEARAFSTTVTVTSIPSYPSGLPYAVTSWYHKGFNFARDGTLSEARFGNGGLVRIRSCRFNGADMELEIQNTHATSNATVWFDGDVRAIRI